MLLPSLYTFRRKSIKAIPANMLIMIWLFTSYSLIAQHLNLRYKVIQSGSEIGWLSLEKTDSANTSFLKFNSEVKKRIVFLFTFIERQEAVFQNGLMLSSYVFRKVNDDIKVNRHTVRSGNSYMVNEEKSSKRLTINGIYYNQLSLYFSEPSNIQQVYSDNYGSFVNIEKDVNGSYKIKFPDGSINHYYYTKGICSKIRVERTLFTVEFILSR